MTASTTQALTALISPYTAEESAELPYYNAKLEETIGKLRELIPTLDQENRTLAERWVRRLTVRIEDNNHYVSQRKQEDNYFSVYKCVAVEDLPGLKFLLRTGRDPNEFRNGKAPIHIAAQKGLRDFVAVLLENPHTDLSIKARNGKTARELTADNTILALMQ